MSVLNVLMATIDILSNIICSSMVGVVNEHLPYLNKFSLQDFFATQVVRSTQLSKTSAQGTVIQSQHDQSSDVYTFSS